LLEELLDNQVILTTCQSSPNIVPRQIQTMKKHLQRSKNSLLHILTQEELEEICQTQEEVTELEIQIEQQTQAQILQPTNNPTIPPKK